MSVEKPLHGFSSQISVFEHKISRAIKRPADFFAVRIDFYAEVFVRKKNTNPDFVSGFVQFASGGALVA